MHEDLVSEYSYILTNLNTELDLDNVESDIVNSVYPGMKEGDRVDIIFVSDLGSLDYSEFQVLEKEISLNDDFIDQNFLTQSAYEGFLNVIALSVAIPVNDDFPKDGIISDSETTITHNTTTGELLRLEVKNTHVHFVFSSINSQDGSIYSSNTVESLVNTTFPILGLLIFPARQILAK